MSERIQCLSAAVVATQEPGVAISHAGIGAGAPGTPAPLPRPRFGMDPYWFSLAMCACLPSPCERCSATASTVSGRALTTPTSRVTSSDNCLCGLAVKDRLSTIGTPH